jgi:NhaA family Na+:H+ antiporter
MLRSFLATETASGFILVGAAAAALVVANSPLGDAYAVLLHREIAGLSVLHWVNDGLMAVFFLLVGLEIKREVIDGELSTTARRILPGIAAIAGMAVPALLYIVVARGDATALRGWAIPAATDIAFALAVLAVLGKRVPPSLRIFLTAVAIIDDLGAIVVIAIFYTASVDTAAVAAAIAGVAVLIALNRSRVTALWPYLMVGAVVWYFVHASGIHATLAGVAVAMTIPLQVKHRPSPLQRLERALNPLVSFGIVPIFGLANAGISFVGASIADLVTPLPLGIIAGLVVGKQAGVFGAVWMLCRLGVASRPRGASWRQIYGVAVLCGIGFTMSLFIASLAFSDGSANNHMAKLGIILGSVASAGAGYLTLAGARR